MPAKRNSKAAPLAQPVVVPGALDASAPVPEPVPATSAPVPEPVLASFASAPVAESDDASECFHELFKGLALTMPPSVRTAVIKRLTKNHIDPAAPVSDEQRQTIQAELEKASGLYARKRERARETAAKKRAAAVEPAPELVPAAA